jgi:hypothetical protein
VHVMGKHDWELEVGIRCALEVGCLRFLTPAGAPGTQKSLSIRPHRQ